MPPPTAADADSEAATTVVWLHPDAPAKPLEGAPCNGCGLCCLTEPCPLGAIVSRKRMGACKALRWSDADRRYWCGMVLDPGSVTGLTHPWAVRVLATLARRWIASSVGCDAQLQTQAVPPHGLPPPSPPPVAPPLPPTTP
ncbi:hypothetical protein [Acidovorax sp.]|uniref:hypothetical protein n=1 Tax=Acidovorax sp. TaxID=1872122 RepID=UPI00391A7C43